MQQDRAFTQQDHFPPSPRPVNTEKTNNTSNNKKWYKRPRYWVVAGVVIVVGAITASRFAPEKIEYTTAPVERKDLVQTVSATGTVEANVERDLHFEKSGGVIDKIYVDVGVRVREGDVLAKLDTTDFDIQLKEAQSALGVAQANLNIVLAGSKPQDIAVSRENVNQAQTSYDNAVRDNDALEKKLEADIKDAQTKLNDTTETQATAVNNARQNILTTIGNVLVTARQSLDDVDTVLDDVSLGPTFSIKNPQYENNARSAYDDAIAKVESADNALGSAKADQSEAHISAAVGGVSSTLDAVRRALDNTFGGLGASIPNSNITQTEIDVYKSNIIGEQVNTNTSISSVQSVDQAYATAKLTQTSTVNAAQNALDTLLTNKDVQLAASQAKIDSAFAALNLAKAQLSQVQAGPRSVDVSYYQAQVQQAQAKVDLLQNQANDYYIYAPKDGIITFVNYKEGEIPSNVGSQAGTITSVISMVGEEEYEIDVDIPESDIIKIKDSDQVSITLDAYGDDVKFSGSVKKIDIASTVIQDVVYYKVTVSLDPAGYVIKSGMTANVDIITAQKNNVLVIPQRGILEVNGRRYVRILINNKPVESDVGIGLRGDNGEVEALTGVQAGDQIIIFEKIAK